MIIKFNSKVLKYNGKWMNPSTSPGEKYHVYTSATHGTVTATPNEAYPGTVITLTNSPDAYYEFNYYTVDGVQIVGNTFIMPDHSVTVSAVFSLATYSISITQVAHGTIFAPSTGHYGDTITISSTPDATYELDYYTVNGIAISGNTFTMPASNVVISGAFKFVAQPLYVNRLNDLRHTTDKAHWLAPYMTMFENQSITPQTGSYASSTRLGGWTIGTVTPNGSMPSSYAGMPEAKFKDESNASYCGYLLETSSMNEYTWGIWVKTGAQPPRGGIHQMIVGCIEHSYYIQKFAFRLNDVSGGEYSDLSWGNATVQKFNGATGTIFANWPGDLNEAYSFGFTTSANTWYYVSTYFNRTTHTVEYYIDGTLYFRLTNVPDIIFTDTSHYRSSQMFQRNIASPHKNDADEKSMAPSFCEYVIYQGKHTEVPTQPLVIT